MYFYTFLLFDHPSHAQICAAGEVTGKLQFSGMYWWKKLHEKLLPWIDLGGLLFGQLDSNSARPFYLVGPDESTNEIRTWIRAYESFQLAHLQNSLHMYYTNSERSVSSVARCLHISTWVPGVSLFEFQVSYFKGPGDHQMTFGIYELGSTQSLAWASLAANVWSIMANEQQT